MNRRINLKTSKAIFFDLDGTLLDTAPDFIHTIKTLAKQENLSLNKINENYFKPCISAGSADMLEYAFNIKETDKNFADIKSKFLKIYQNTNYAYSKPFLGIEAIINTLNNYNITWGIVTNKPTFLTEEIILQKSFLQKAAVVICGDTLKYSKPHPAQLNYASDKINIKNSNCVYIGDAERDIIAANAAFMTSVTAMYGYVPSIQAAKKWPANFLAETVEKLHTWLLKHLNL